MTNNEIIVDNACDNDYHKTLHKGEKFSRKKSKHEKDGKQEDHYKCDCSRCVDGKLHKHKRNNPIVSVEEEIEEMYALSEDLLDEEVGGYENR